MFTRMKRYPMYCVYPLGLFFFKVVKSDELNLLFMVGRTVRTYAEINFKFSRSFIYRAPDNSMT